MAARPRLLWKTLVVVALLLAGAGLAGPPAAAYHTGIVKPVSDHIAETIDLAMNTYAGYTFSISPGDRLSYSLVVTTGAPIDMYIVSASGLADYSNDSASSFVSFARVEMNRTISGVFTAVSSTAGLDTVIVDNVDFTGQVASGPVNVTVDLTREISQLPSLALLAGIVLAIIVAIIVVALVIVRARRKRAAEPGDPTLPTGRTPPPPPAR